MLSSCVFLFVMCLSVRLSVRPFCPSQAGIVSKRLDESSWFLAWELCNKEIRLPPKIRILPTGILSQALDLEKFVAAS